MRETSKILDVTYGTFSCRLEGFDDSVETMKTVVTFFHELAGHDRFMDMAPQAPDLNTLAELTTQQAGMPVEVEAEAESQRLSLRVQRPDAETPPAQEERPSLRIQRPAAAPTTPTVDDQNDDDHSTMEAENTAAEETDLIAAEHNDDADLDDANSDEDFANEMSDEETDEQDEAAFDDTAEDDAPAEDAPIVLTSGDDAEEETVAEQPAPAAEPEVDTNESVAAKLQRIRAIVSRSAETQTDTYAEDLTEQTAPSQGAVSAPATNPLAQRLAELAKRNAALAAQDDDIDDDADDMAIHAKDDAPAAPLMADDESAFDDFDEDDEDLDAELTEEELAEFAAEEDQDEDFDDTAENFLTDDLPEPAEALADNEEEATEDDAALMHETAVQIETEGTDAPDETDTDEEDLHEQVAEVERAIAIRRENRSKRDELPGNVDAAMSRILSQADERLNEPEGRRHRDAFAQLRAAVAATEAARQLGDPGAEARDPGEAFREDLDAHEADEAQEAASDVPDTPSAPAPLRLVPAQRIDDVDQPSDRAAERLRRIASQKQEEVGEKAGGFAEFAAQKGATELADLLEAAAAYIAFVEGDDDFSRPQVMKKVQMASADEFSREDGLRSFGRLLRQSRIIKLNNGRFQVSEDTRFRPDDKAAQG